MLVKKIMLITKLMDLDGILVLVTIYIVVQLKKKT